MAARERSGFSAERAEERESIVLVDPNPDNPQRKVRLSLLRSP